LPQIADPKGPEGRVRAFVESNFVLGPGDDLSEDTSFLARGILDSTGVIELVGFLEQEFGVKVADDEIVPENLDSLRAIGAYLKRKIGA
jgi:acyl carrier protein